MAISLIFATGCGANPTTSIGNEQNQFNYEAKEIYSADGSRGISSIAMGRNGELAVFKYHEKKIYIFDKNGAKTGELKAEENWDGALYFDKDNKLYALLQYRVKNNNNDYVLLERQLRMYDIQKSTLEEQSDIVEIKSDNIIGEVVEKIEVDSQGNIYCLKANEEVEVSDKKPKSIKTI